MYFHLAAAVIIAIAAGSWYFIYRKNNIKPGYCICIRKEDDVLPGTNKAVLTLDNGETLLLDDAQNGVLATGKHRDQ